MSIIIMNDEKGNVLCLTNHMVIQMIVVEPTCQLKANRTSPQHRMLILRTFHQIGQARNFLASLPIAFRAKVRLYGVVVIYSERSRVEEEEEEILPSR